MSAQAKRQCVRHLVTEMDFSERRACLLMDIARSSHRYEAKPAADEEDLRAKIRYLADENKAYGYRMVTAKIREEGWLVNKKRVQRIWREEGLQQTRRKPRKRFVGPKGEVRQKAKHPNHVWSYDFTEDRTEKGGKLRILAIMDEFTRECLFIHVAKSIRSKTVISILEWLFLVQGVPEHIRSDNGPEFIAKVLRKWLTQQDCETIYINPGSPWENPFIESFIGTLRNECLDQYLFIHGREAQEVIEAWQYEYNHYRPHSSLGYMTPAAFAEQQKMVIKSTDLPARKEPDIVSI